MPKTFSIGEALAVGWRETWKNWVFLVCVGLIYFVLSALLGGDYYHRASTPVIVIAGFAQVVFSVVSSLVFLQLFLRLADGHAVGWSTLFSGLSWKKALFYVVASILTTLLVLVGLVLLIVPGIIAMIALSFYQLAIIEGAGPLEALKKSYTMTKGHWWRLFLLWVVLVFVVLAGVLALGVGLLFAIPIAAIAYSHVYRHLLSTMTVTVSPQA